MQYEITDLNNLLDLRRLVWRYTTFLSISWLLYIDLCVCVDVRAILTALACVSICANVDLRVCL